MSIAATDAGDRAAPAAPTGAPVLAATTVLLVRDGREGLEAMVLRRNLRSDFLGGAYVFPGGATDPSDQDPAVYARCAGLDDATASTRLGVGRDGLGSWVTGVRETFEEAGLLLAHPRGSGELVSFAHPDVARRFDGHRRAVDGGERTMAYVCAEEDLELAVGGLRPVARWVTPTVASRRYDTWFLLGVAPPAQVERHDDDEVIDAVWVLPSVPLAAHRRGELDMMYPTVCLLEWLARAGSTAEALAAADQLAELPRIEPRVVDDGGGGRLLLMPGDEGYGSAPDAIGTGGYVRGADLLRLCRERVLARHPGESR
jgi:8-oxo-dGTP pyrophosphatase MutT (NUDIX family)